MQKSKRIVLSPPDYYELLDSLNPYTDTSVKIDQEKAQAQYKVLKSTYQSVGATVIDLPAVKGLPDYVYATNHGYGEGNIFIRANPKPVSRQTEPDHTVKVLEQLGYKIETLPPEVIFEGEGDLLRSETKYFMGWGVRTSKDAPKYCEKILNKPIIPIELKDPYFFHLDVCFSAISDDVAMVNPKALSQEGLDVIKKSFPTVIELTDPADIAAWAPNLVVYEKNILLGQGISQGLRERLTGLGYKVHEVDVSEYKKGGGCVKCVSLELHA